MINACNYNKWNCLFVRKTKGIYADVYSTESQIKEVLFGKSRWEKQCLQLFHIWGILYTWAHGKLIVVKKEEKKMFKLRPPGVKEALRPISGNMILPIKNRIERERSRYLILLFHFFTHRVFRHVSYALCCHSHFSRIVLKNI